MFDSSAHTRPLRRVSALAVALALVYQASAVEARTIYRIGGEELPEPALNDGDVFVQRSWAEVLDSPDGMTEALEIQPGFIAPEKTDPTTNLAPNYFENGFSIKRGSSWERPQSMMAWQPERFSKWMIDGDTTTVYECDTFKHIGNLCSGFDYAYKFDLGKQIYLDRIRYYAREKSRLLIPRFIIGVNDGNQLLDGTRDYLPAYNSNFVDEDRLDFDVLYDGPGGEITEIRFKPTPAEQLLFHVFRNLDGGSISFNRVPGEQVAREQIDEGSARANWEIVEFEFFASGFAPVARYTSPVIDLGGDVSIGPLSWAGDQPEETLVAMRMRGGGDEDPNTYWRKTFRGFEQVPWSDSGTLLTRSAYDKMELAEKGDITLDLDNWDSWSANYDFGALQGTSAASGSRTHAQFDVTFESPADTSGRLDYVQFATSPRLLTNVVAEIDPPAAAPDEVTGFTYLLKPQWEPDERGFDGVVVDTDARVVSVDGVAITTPAGTESLVEGTEWETTRLDSLGFAIRLTEPIDSADESFNIVRISFRARVYAYDTLFSGSVTHSEIPLEIPQPAVEGDADELADGNSLRVALSTIPKEPIQSMSLSSSVFTPNGDGVNDRVMVEYELLNLSGGTPTTLGVFDLSGRMVGEVFSDDGVVSGYSTVEWNGTDGKGSLLPPGIYILQLKVDADDGEDRVQRTVSLVY